MPSSASVSPIAVYTLSLHDALPICRRISASSRYEACCISSAAAPIDCRRSRRSRSTEIRSTPTVGRSRTRAAFRSIAPGSPSPSQSDRKSTRLNSSHLGISYAVFCFRVSHRCLHSFPTRRSSDLQAYFGLVALRGMLYFIGGSADRLSSIASLSLDGNTIDTDGRAIADAGRIPVDRTWFSVPESIRSEEHTSELQSLRHLVCRLLLPCLPSLSTLFPYTTLFRSAGVFRPRRATRHAVFHRRQRRSIVVDRVALARRKYDRHRRSGDRGRGPHSGRSHLVLRPRVNQIGRAHV